MTNTVIKSFTNSHVTAVTYMFANNRDNVTIYIIK